MARGKMQKAASGKYVGNGKVPYGYIRANDTLIVNELEAAIVKRVFDLYASTTGESLGIRTIARLLSDEGVPSPSVSANRNYHKQQVGWCAYAVHWMLQNEIYTGVYRYGRRKGAGGKGGMRAISDCPAVPVPRLVDQSVFDAVQAKLELNKKHSLRHVKYEYLLRGRCFCAECGHIMRGDTRRDWRDKTKLRTYYRCARAAHRHKALDQQCQKAYYYGDKIEGIAWDFVKQVIVGDGYEAAIREAFKQDQASQAPLQSEFDRANRQLAECLTEARELASAFAKSKSDLMRTAVQQQIEALEDRHAKLTRVRDDAAKALKSANSTAFSVEAALAFRKEIEPAIANATFEDKRFYLDVLEAEVRIDKTGQIDVKLMLPKKTIRPRSATSPPPSPPCSQTPH